MTYFAEPTDRVEDALQITREILSDLGIAFEEDDRRPFPSGSQLILEVDNNAGSKSHFVTAFQAVNRWDDVENAMGYVIEALEERGFYSFHVIGSR